MEPIQNDPASEYAFLRGSGEIGNQIALHKWSETSLGTIAHWPVSLRSALSVLLQSTAPMLLLWGKDLFCFYNQAFHSNLKNPANIPPSGSVAPQLWDEHWSEMMPYVASVMAEEKPVSLDNKYVPFYCSNVADDGNETSTLSTIFGDDQQPAGVLFSFPPPVRNVQTIEKLRASERRFQTLIREATVGIIVVMGEEYEVAIVNAAFGKLINRNVDVLLSQPLFEILPEAENIFRTNIDHVRKNGEPLRFDEHLYRSSIGDTDKEGFFNFIYQPYREDDGSVNGVMILCQDVTEGVVARKELEASEQAVRSIIESAPFPIGIYTGREMRIAFVNQSIINVWGKGPDVVGKIYAEVLPELANQNIYMQLDKVFMTGEPFHARNQRVDLMVDGRLQPFYFNYSFTPLYDASGSIYGVMNTAADVTDLFSAKQQVEQSERNFRSMIRQAPVAMCLLGGANHIIEEANDLMIEIWGKYRGDVMGKPVFEALPEARQQGLEDLLCKVYQTGETFIASERPVVLQRHGKEETVYQNFAYQPYRDGENSVVGVIAISVDVSHQVVARQKIEELVAARTVELASANENLRKTNAELEQFAYVTSHDLQEPVRKVSTFAEMLASSVAPTDQRSLAYVDRIRNSALRMSALIRGILTYSQIKTDERAYESVDLQTIIDDVSQDFELLIEQYGATIITENLPVIEAIPLHMSQLFANLLSNALKFRKQDVAPQIRITAEPASDELVTANELDSSQKFYSIQFADNGIGFEQQYASQIFSIFQRLHGRQQYEGTGIGLALCLKIVQNHHGNMRAFSDEGKGAVFSMLLPARQPVF